MCDKCNIEAATHVTAFGSLVGAINEKERDDLAKLTWSYLYRSDLAITPEVITKGNYFGQYIAKKLCDIVNAEVVGDTRICDDIEYKLSDCCRETSAKHIISYALFLELAGKLSKDLGNEIMVLYLLEYDLSFNFKIASEACLHVVDLLRDNVSTSRCEHGR